MNLSKAVTAALTDAYDQGWHDALTAITQVLKALPAEQALAAVETLRDNPPAWTTP